MELPKAYDPKKTEEKIYKLWLKSGFFNPDNLPSRHKKPYTIVIPPPNVTGELHMGHALNATIQDILIRFKRLQGFKTLWLPGTDHAGIATQNVMEKELKKEGKTRFDLGREKFIERVWQWKEKYGNLILEQFKKIGCSLDWSRTRFTLDEDYSLAVKKAFLYYHKKGWIYQGERTINWCVRCATSLSDLEIEYKEEQTELYYIKYGPITIATVRPETKLGDTAIAVNPKDKRYQKYIGETIDIQTVLGPAKMKVIADDSVDMEFGTGAMKVTPAHDLRDFELGEKHNLEKKQVIGPDARMTKLAGKYEGLKVLEAREKIVEDMKGIGILEKTEPYTHNIAKCYRCNTNLEPILSKQWFLSMKELAKLAEIQVKTGKIKFHPKNFEKPYLDWLKNIKDWCISRQIWWGHKIPIEGVNDVLDTWFSSALWPFATLGWPTSASTYAKASADKKATAGKPKKTSDLEMFYPTNVLVTDRGIINLWVARMIFSGMEFMKKSPFKNVHINATVLTKEGKRMSKSLGTGVNPMDLIEKYGADALRFGLIWQNMGNQDMRWSEEHVVAGKKFCNKIWNACRFAMLNTTNPEDYPQKLGKNNLMTSEDKKIYETLEKTKKTVSSCIEKFEFGQALHLLYEFFWHEFCDKYIEHSKKQLNNKVVGYVILDSLKLLHPFLPFITEEIYQNLPMKNKKPSLMVEESI